MSQIKLLIVSFKSAPSSAFLIPAFQGFLGATRGKEPACQCRRHKRPGFSPWVRKIPWRRAWQPTPVFLPGKFHGQRSLEGYSLLGHKESGMTEAICMHTLTPIFEVLCQRSWGRGEGLFDSSYSLTHQSQSTTKSSCWRIQNLTTSHHLFCCNDCVASIFPTTTEASQHRCLLLYLLWIHSRVSVSQSMLLLYVKPFDNNSSCQSKSFRSYNHTQGPRQLVFFILVITSSLITTVSLVAQTVKHLPAMQETQVRSLGWEDPPEKEMATHSSTFAWKIPWMEEPGRLQSMWSQRVRHTSERLHFHFLFTFFSLSSLITFLPTYSSWATLVLTILYASPLRVFAWTISQPATLAFYFILQYSQLTMLW